MCKMELEQCTIQVEGGFIEVPSLPDSLLDVVDKRIQERLLYRAQDFPAGEVEELVQCEEQKLASKIDKRLNILRQQ